MKKALKKKQQPQTKKVSLIYFELKRIYLLRTQRYSIEDVAAVAL